jgi:hypothetical protein
MNMSVNKHHLHAMIDLIDDDGLKTLYNVMLRFIPEDEASPDEIEGIAAARKEYDSGEFVRYEDINWD